MIRHSHKEHQLLQGANWPETTQPRASNFQTLEKLQRKKEKAGRHEEKDIFGGESGDNCALPMV